jgi:hypothetical protein
LIEDGSESESDSCGPQNGSGNFSTIEASFLAFQAKKKAYYGHANCPQDSPHRLSPRKVPLLLHPQDLVELSSPYLAIDVQALRVTRNGCPGGIGLLD